MKIHMHQERVLSHVEPDPHGGRVTVRAGGDSGVQDIE